MFQLENCLLLVVNYSKFKHLFKNRNYLGVCACDGGEKGGWVGVCVCACVCARVREREIYGS
jgi:hypothetical protein